MIDIIKGVKQLPWKLRISVMSIITPKKKKKKKLIIKKIARKILGLFWSFCSNFLVQGYFGHFLSLWHIQVILYAFFLLGGGGGWGISINLEVSLIFWSFLKFKGILVIFKVQGIFWSIFKFKGYFGNFNGYFGHFLDFGVCQSFSRFYSILVILRFWGYCGHFRDFKSILVIFVIQWILVIQKFQEYFCYI